MNNAYIPQNASHATRNQVIIHEKASITQSFVQALLLANAFTAKSVDNAQIAKSNRIITNKTDEKTKFTLNFHIALSLIYTPYSILRLNVPLQRYRHDNGNHESEYVRCGLQHGKVLGILSPFALKSQVRRAYGYYQHAYGKPGYDHPSVQFSKDSVVIHDGRIEYRQYCRLFPYFHQIEASIHVPDERLGRNESNEQA